MAMTSSRSSSHLLLRLEFPGMGISRTVQLALDSRNHELVLRKLSAWCAEVKRWDPNHTVVHDQLPEYEFMELSHQIASSICCSPAKTPRCSPAKTPRGTESPFSGSSSSCSSRSSSANSALVRDGERIALRHPRSKLPTILASPRHGYQPSLLDKSVHSKGTLDHAWAGASSRHQTLIQTLDANIVSLKSNQSHQAADTDVASNQLNKQEMVGVWHTDASATSCEEATTITVPHLPMSPPTSRPRRRRQAVRRLTSFASDQVDIASAYSEVSGELMGASDSTSDPCAAMLPKDDALIPTVKDAQQSGANSNVSRQEDGSFLDLHLCVSSVHTPAT